MITAALVGDPDECPHPNKRAQHRITAFPSGRSLDLCLECYQGLCALIQAWDDGALERDHIYRWFARAGWPRSDADAFITETLEAA